MSTIYTVSSGETVTGKTLRDELMLIDSGGTVISPTVNSGGTLYIDSGGTAKQIKENGGHVISQTGAWISFVPNAFTGLTLTSKNGSSGVATVHSGTTAIRTTVNYLGGLLVHSGGIATNTMVNSIGRAIVLSGGTANSAIVNSGGSLYVSSGGTATQILENGGYVSVEVGANVTFVPNTLYGLVMSTYAATVHSGTVAECITVKAVYFYICSGGTANSTTVTNGGILKVSAFGFANSTMLSSGSMNVLTYGKVYNTTVGSGGRMSVDGTASITTIQSDGIMNIFVGGTATYTTVSSGGVMNVLSGGTATAYTAIKSGGSLVVSSGGTATSTTVDYGAQLVFHSGAKVTQIRENGGYVSSVGGATVSFASNTFSDLTITDSATVHSGTTAIRTTLSGGGFLDVCGGTANGTIVNDEGRLWVYENGKATSTTVNSNGEFGIYTGGTAAFTTVNTNGLLDVYYGYASRTTLNGGVMKVSKGATANTTTLSGGSMEVFADATADMTDLSGGSMVVFGGGAASNTYISGGTQLIHEQAVASHTVVYENGRMEVYGGSASGASVYGGLLVVNSKGVVSGASIYDEGYLRISSGGTGSYTTLSGGSLFVSNGGQAAITTVSAGGRLEVLNGGMASVTTLRGGASGSQGGTLYVANGGKAATTYVSSGGRLLVRSNAVQSATSVFSGGTVHVYSGGMQTGMLTLTDGADVTVDRGGIIDFDISKSSAGAVARVNNLSLVNGTPTYTLTVAAGQGTGTYTLAENAANFNNTVTVKNTSATALGTLSVGATTAIDGTYYTLNLGNDNKLSVAISLDAPDTTLPTVKNVKANITAPTNQNVTVTAEFTDNVAVASKLYRIDNGDWKDYANGVTVTQNANLSFKAVDTAGNESEIVVFTVGNIDKTPPAKPTATPSTTAQTTQSVTVTATFSNDSAQKQYSLDNKNWNNYTAGVVMAANGTVYFRGIDAAGNISDVTSYAVTNINTNPVPQNPSGNSARSMWNSTGSAEYVVEYSPDDFKHVFRKTVSTNSLDSFRMPSGTYRWRVRAIDGTEWADGNEIAVGETESTPQLIQPEANGDDDIFFARKFDTWNGFYRARHFGLYNGWEGTGETAQLNGKNRIADIFLGSTDPNLLSLTDDANGDALFVDDIFTELPGSLSEQQARLAQINEIRAGAGDDIVDLTSQKFEYVGGGVTVRGGLGDDVIWANKGDNTLFGDAGDDRVVGANGNDVIVGGMGNDSMHGGGGEDIFAFVGGWGNDNVEQLADGKVTLWFEEGSLDKWDADTLTYRDGDKSVAVSGVTAANISLKFGDDGSAQYDKLLAAGAFDEFSSERIFENKNTRGMLASR